MRIGPLGVIGLVGAVALIVLAVMSAPSNRQDAANDASDQASAANDAGSSSDGDKAAEAGPPHKWWGVEIDGETCSEAHSPSKRIQSIREVGKTPETEDTNDDSGSLVSVKVGEPMGFGQVENMTFYVSKDACDAALAKANTIPDRYK